MILLLSPAHGQTLDEAVVSQLIDNCEFLLHGDEPSIALTGTLQQICLLGSGVPPLCPDPSVPELDIDPEDCPADFPPLSPNSAGGGSAATPAKLPGIIERRLREARAKDTGNTSSGGAASADAVSTFPSGLSVFVSGQILSLDKAVTASQDGYGSDIERITAGIDYQFTPKFDAGVALDFYQHEGKFVEDGKFNDESMGFYAFGLIAPRDEFYFQFLAGYAQTDSRRERFGTLEGIDFAAFITAGTITSSSDSDQYRIGGLGAYKFLSSKVTVILRIGLDLSLIKFNGLVEQGTQTQEEFLDVSSSIEGSTGLELQFNENEVASLQTMIGLQAYTELPIYRVGIFVPHVSADWKHEFEQNQHDVKVSFVEDLRSETFSFKSEKPDRDWIEFSTGLTLNLQQGLQLFGHYRTLIGHSLFSSHTVALGMRTAFQ